MFYWANKLSSVDNTVLVYLAMQYPVAAPSFFPFLEQLLMTIVHRIDQSDLRQERTETETM